MKRHLFQQASGEPRKWNQTSAQASDHRDLNVQGPDFLSQAEAGARCPKPAARKHLVDCWFEFIIVCLGPAREPLKFHKLFASPGPTAGESFIAAKRLVVEHVLPRISGRRMSSGPIPCQHTRVSNTSGDAGHCWLGMAWSHERKMFADTRRIEVDGSVFSALTLGQSVFQRIRMQGTC